MLAIGTNCVAIMDGIININKPPDETSFRVVAAIKRITKERRVGHGGTLDPLATGVLPVFLGQATRVVEYLAEASKTYRAVIEMGKNTDTYDITGKIVDTADFSMITRNMFEETLGSFRGDIEQIPPMYSAVKYQGEPLYKLARKGITIERKPRLAHIYQITIIEWQPPLVTLDVECSKGTYIRSLAHDIGRTLECGACLKELVRLKYGFMNIEDAISLQEFEHALRFGYWQNYLYPLDRVLSQWQAIIVNEEREKAIRNGNPLDTSDFIGVAGEQVSDIIAGNRCRAYSMDGTLVSILKYDEEKNHWRPDKVFMRQDS